MAGHVASIGRGSRHFSLVFTGTFSSTGFLVSKKIFQHT